MISCSVSHGSVSGLRAALIRAAVSAVAIGLVVFGTGCGSSGSHPGPPQPTAHRSTTPATVSARGRAVAPISVSFISSSTGWLLGQPQCAIAAGHPCRTLLLRKTTDGGRTWSTLAALPAPATLPGRAWSGARAVSQILFASARFGWAYGPGIWVTEDGGHTWHPTSVHGQPVQAMAYAHGRVIAAAGACQLDAGVCRFSVFSARVGSSEWRLIAGAGLTTWQPPASVTAVDGTGYVFTTTPDLGPPVLLTGPLDGSAPWHPVRTPCRQTWSIAVATASGGWLFLGCGSEPGAGNQMKDAYLSHDSGRTWRRVGSPPLGGYLGFATMTPGGTIFLSGGRMDLYVSRDRGRTWHVSHSLDNAAALAGAGFMLVAATTGASTGIAYQKGVYQRQFWLSGDQGRTWTGVTVR